MIVWFEKADIKTITTPVAAQAAITALNNVINTLMSAMAQSALTGNMKEYSFDDGQTKTRVEYKDVAALSASINALMAIQQVYLQMPGMNSRVIRLIDSKNMPNYWGNLCV